MKTTVDIDDYVNSEGDVMDPSYDIIKVRKLEKPGDASR
jgi:hypothetical protein